MGLQTQLQRKAYHGDWTSYGLNCVWPLVVDDMVG